MVFKAAAAAAKVSRHVSKGGKYPLAAAGGTGGGMRGCMNAGLKRG